MSENITFKIDRIHELENSGALKAFCSLLIADKFIAKGFKILEGKEGLFVGMPQEQGRDGKWYDTFYPICKDAHKNMQKQILDEYAEHKKIIRRSE